MWLRRVLLLLLSLAILVPASSSALSPYPSGTTGSDVSWPKQNCQAKPPADAAFGIVGIDGGLDFTKNNCASQEAGWFPNYSLYLNTGYPGAAWGRKYQNSPRHCGYYDTLCLAYNYGYNNVIYSLSYADLHNLHTTHWWLDVETDNSWATDSRQNIASLEGMIAGLKIQTFLPQIGFYAYPGQWNRLTNSWHNGYTAWAATGTTSRLAAIAACQAKSFTGGPVILTQYTKQLDANYVCPTSKALD